MPGEWGEAPVVESKPVRGYRIEKKGRDVTMALTAGGDDVATFVVVSVNVALQLADAWERSL